MNIINIFCNKNQDCEFRNLYNESWDKYFKIKGNSWSVDCKYNIPSEKEKYNDYLFVVNEFANYYKSVYFKKLKNKAKQMWNYI